MRLLSRLFAFGHKTRARCGPKEARFRPWAEVLEDRTVPAFLRVDPNFSIFFPTIQSAITAANPGDIILVDQATYNEDIVINKQLTLLGQGASKGQLPVIKGVGGRVAENMVRIADNISGVVINNFDIENPNGQGKFQVGVAIGAGAGNIVITNCSIHDVRDSTRAVAGGSLNVGILINPSAHNLQIRSNFFSNITYSTQGVGSGGQSGYGIYSFSRGITDGQDVAVISSNAFTNIGDVAIVVDDASQHFTIDSNNITNVQGLRRGEGIEVAGTHGSPTSMLITNNIVTGVVGNQPVGILIGGTATAVSVQFNRFTGISGGIGLSVATSGDVNVLLNNFTNNAIGVVVDPAFSGNLKLTVNNISGNSVAGLFNASVKRINAQLNWWGSFTGPAASGNPFGLGDKIFGNVDFSRFLFGPISF